MSEYLIFELLERSLGHRSLVLVLGMSKVYGDSLVVDHLLVP